MAYGIFSIPLFIMQRVMEYLLALQDFDFCRFCEHKRPITSKSKEVAYTIITLPEAKRFMFFFFMSSLFLSKTGIGLKLFFRS